MWSLHMGPVHAQCTSTWTPYDSNDPVNTVRDMIQWDPDGDGPLPPEWIIASSSPWADFAGTKLLGYLGRWNPTVGEWEPFAGGTNGPVWALEVMPNGDLVAAGNFSKAGYYVGGTAGHGIDVGNVARWDGTKWHAYNDPAFGLGPGLIMALQAMPNGDLVVGGQFERSAGGITLRNVARWSEVAQGWQPFGGGVGTEPSNGSAVHALALTPSGLVAGGGFSHVNAPLALGGTLAMRIALWNGSSWQPMGGPPHYGMGPFGGLGWGDVLALLTLPSGDLIVGGWFGLAGEVEAYGVARWDGTHWHDLDLGVEKQAGFPKPISLVVRALARLPDGEILVGGAFTKVGTLALPTGGIARFNLGSGTWSQIGQGAPAGSAVHAFLLHPDYGLLAGGDHLSLTGGGPPAYGLAQLQTSCTAGVTSQPTACVGPAGPLTLVAETAPWTGFPLKVRAHGFAPGTTAFGVIGFSALTVPLTALDPSGLPGCNLSVFPDVLLPLAPQADGTASFAVLIPDDPALAGLTFHHQFVQAQSGGGGGFASLSSSNALTLVVGVL